MTDRAAPTNSTVGRRAGCACAVGLLFLILVITWVSGSRSCAPCQARLRFVKGLSDKELVEATSVTKLNAQLKSQGFVPVGLEFIPESGEIRHNFVKQGETSCPGNAMGALHDPLTYFALRSYDLEVYFNVLDGKVTYIGYLVRYHHAI